LTELPTPAAALFFEIAHTFAALHAFEAAVATARPEHTR
jgi:hypothetical protein